MPGLIGVAPFRYCAPMSRVVGVNLPTPRLGRSTTRSRGATFALLLAIGLLATVAAGCESGGTGAAGETAGAQPRGDAPAPENRAPNQTLNVYAFSKPPSFDPGQQGPATFAGNALRRQYTEALLKPKPGALEVDELGVTPAAAKSYDVSPDGLTYTFRLRDDGRFNDGRPVTAKDFVFAWRRLIDPRLAAPLGGKFASVVEGGEQAASLGPESGTAKIEAALDDLGLRAVDRTTFEVKLARPAPYFKWIATLTAGAPIREDVVKKFGSDEWATKPKTLITNGPFKVAEIGQSATTMVRNTNYRENPILTKLVANYGLDPAPRWARYLNDQLDVSNGPPPAAKEATRRDPRFSDELITFPELSNQWLQFNTRKPPFDNPKVRLAFAQAIDREAYARVSSEAVARTMTTLIPEGMRGYSPELGEPQEFASGKAKATLRSSGVGAEELEGIEILTAPPQQTDALFIQDQLKKNLGITTKIKSVGDDATLMSQVQKGEYDLKTNFIGHTANYPDPQDFFAVFLSQSPTNQTGWSNARYDRLVNRAGATPDENERQQLYDQAQQLLVREAPVAFLAQLERVYYVKPRVKGITRTPVDTAWLPGDLYTTRIGMSER